ncbi:MAG TPA: SIS domain-containing protein [Candidatus Acidoferrales bacterium]|nr:SIS domain-containing protein [Candidatus Acidoferrales bacterium]
MGLRDEIREQPAAATRQLESSEGALEAIAARVRGEGITSVVIAARGTSDHAAIYGQYVLGVRNAMTVGLATPSVVSLYGADPVMRGSLVIGISQSGASPDIVAVLAAARHQGAPTLAITNDPRSALAQAADQVVELAAGPEHAIAATKTYTTSLLALARLSVALGGTDSGASLGTDPGAGAGATADPAAALAAIPGAMQAALATEKKIAALAGELAGAEGSMDKAVIVGRGFEYATAREWALKLKELAQSFADPYSAADFLHGPIALVQRGVPVFLLLPTGAAADGLEEVAETLQVLDAELVIVSDDARLRALGRHAIAIPADIPEWLRPIVSIVPAQLFAYHVARVRGLDPDAPRYLRKVTRTL